jgi:AraC-like DNA-binding protein
MKTVTSPKVLIHLPAADLRPFIRRILLVEFPSALQDSHLPDVGPVAGFRFSGDCVLDQRNKAPWATLTGLYDTLRTHYHGRGSAAVLAIFTATGARAFFQYPLIEFASTTLDMEAVLDRPSELKHVHEQLMEAKSHNQRIRLVEEFLRARMRGRQPDVLVSAAVSLIEERRAMVRIEELVRRVGLSQSALERRFQQVVGLPPKKFSAIVRLQNVIRLRSVRNDLTSIAYEVGYCDQPHFIKDFKRFAGVAPELFFQRMAIN